MGAAGQQTSSTAGRGCPAPPAPREPTGDVHSQRGQCSLGWTELPRCALAAHQASPGGPQAPAGPPRTPGPQGSPRAHVSVCGEPRQQRPLGSSRISPTDLTPEPTRGTREHLSAPCWGDGGLPGAQPPEHHRCPPSTRGSPGLGNKVSKCPAIWGTPSPAWSSSTAPPAKIKGHLAGRLPLNSDLPGCPGGAEDQPRGQSQVPTWGAPDGAGRKLVCARPAGWGRGRLSSV